jgi:hypothetical protein
MSHTVTERFTDDEWRAIYLSIGHSNGLKHKRLRKPSARERMHQEYVDALEKLIAFQEQGQDHYCGRTGSDADANLFAWCHDQLDYSERWDTDLEINSGYQLAKITLLDRAVNRRAGPAAKFQDLFDLEPTDDQE